MKLDIVLDLVASNCFKSICILEQQNGKLTHCNYVNRKEQISLHIPTALNQIEPFNCNEDYIIYTNRPPDKSVYWKTIFFISHPKHMLWVLKRTISMRWFF